MPCRIHRTFSWQRVDIPGIYTLYSKLAGGIYVYTRKGVTAAYKFVILRHLCLPPSYWLPDLELTSSIILLYCYVGIGQQPPVCLCLTCEGEWSQVCSMYISRTTLSSNCAAERFVWKFKEVTKASNHGGRTISHCLKNFCSYDCTVQHFTVLIDNGDGRI